MAIGIALSLFQLWAAGVQPLGLFYQRPIHLGFILVLCFLIYPAFGRDKPRGALGWAIDGPLIVASVVVGAWLPINIDIIANQIFPRDIDVWIGVLTMLVVLEGARRAVRLAGLIAMHARMAQPIRVVKYDDAHMTDVIAQHRKIIATMSGTDTDAYVAATREHLPASAEAYRNLYSRRFGGVRAAG